MKETLSIIDKTPGSQAGAPLARLGPVHGYRFDGDLVSLNAMFTVLNPDAHQKSWALQLWACHSAPASASDLRGQLVAESPLPPIGEVADEQENFELTTAAVPPAGAAEYHMVLALVSGRRGQYDEVHDFAVYPLTEQFVQPSLQGTVGFQIDGDRVLVNIDRIANLRDVNNVSGTLAVELWALSQPYTGGAFDGYCLAGITVGSLAGQTETTGESFDLVYNRPPAGIWNATLMLREWTAAGYVTRDFVNFNIPLNYEATVEIAQPATTPVAVQAPVVVIQAPVAEVKTSVIESKATITEVNAPVTTAPVKAPVAEVKALIASAKATPAKTPVTETKAAVKAATPAAKPVQNAAPVKTATPSVPAQISINTAKVEELVTAGLSKTVAEGIAKKRPFKSIDDLTKIKGVTAKVLAKVRSQFKL
jgi:DNA uptake protein ComE-like DNA-binding protein